MLLLISLYRCGCFLIHTHIRTRKLIVIHLCYDVYTHKRFSSFVFYNRNVKLRSYMMKSFYVWNNRCYECMHSFLLHFSNKIYSIFEVVILRTHSDECRKAHRYVLKVKEKRAFKLFSFNFRCIKQNSRFHESGIGIYGEGYFELR